MDFMAAKHGMADAHHVVLTDEGERLQTRANLAEAIDHLRSPGSISAPIAPGACS
ncbi:hypothetical protein [Streptomyces sp. NPDC090798]|uniref:hypothetical protein n=1 Tax=Streptomyces sp. NPDC090798 TaxID=3365968 RepID=UPI0037FEBCF4